MRAPGRLALVCLLLAVPVTAAAQINFLANPSAEDSLGSSDNFAPCPAPGWTATGTALVARYAVGGGFPTATDPGPVGRGTNFFAGGASAAVSTFTQTVDAAVLRLVGRLGSNGYPVVIGGWFGGFDGQDDHAQLVAEFLDGSSNVLGSLATPQVLTAERAGATGMLYRQAEGNMPEATAWLRATLVFTRTAGTYNDGYADSVFVSLQPGYGAVPAAGAGALRLATLSASPACGAVRFAVEAPERTPARVQMIDVQGRVVGAWRVEAGQRATLAWDGRAGGGAPRAGLFFVRASAGGEAKLLRVALLP